MWEELVGQQSAFEGVLCGHVIGQALTEADGVGYLASAGEDENIVHQLLFNAQHVGDNGGDGWLRLMEFLPDGKTVVVKTYSPYLDSTGRPGWRVDADDWFSFELSPLSPIVPEPPLALLLLTGLAALLVARRPGPKGQ